MGQPAAVLGDKITGQCPAHQMPNPATGAPQPSPPLPFSAPVVMGTANKVLVANKPAVVVGSSGYNVPPHVGLHPSDPCMVPTMQEGKVVQGSPTVFFEGKPAARMGSMVTMCSGIPGQLVATGSTVMIA